MFRQLIIISLFAGILLQATGRLAVLITFQLNQAQIAKEKCEQRQVIANCCQGKCHLKKELKAQENREDKAGQNTLKEKGNCKHFYQPPANIKLAILHSKYLSVTSQIEVCCGTVSQVAHPPWIS